MAWLGRGLTGYNRDRYMKTMLAAFALVLIPAAAQDNSPLLKLVQTIPLVKAEGRIDHLAVDVKRARLYVTASGSDTVEVVDLKQGAVARSLTGFSKPKGALSPAGSNRVFVADGGGTLRILDAEGLNLISSVDLSGVPGALLYDAAARRIYAGFGDSLAVIDAATGRKLGEVKLPGQPEGFEAEKSGARIFVNLPGTNEIAVVDRAKLAVSSKIAVTWAQENYPMALDEAGHRLLVGARKPGKVLVLDTASSEWVTEVAVSDDIGGVLYDARRKRVYAVCGTAKTQGFAGQIYVMDQMDPNHYKIRDQVVTAPGARTGLLAPELNRLYVAAPKKGDQSAKILVYQTQ